MVAQNSRNAPGPLGDRDAEQGLARLADFGALGDEAQPIEVHVRAAQHRDEPSRRVVPVRSTHARTPATASAPAGSMIDRVSSKMSLIAAQISSFDTRTISSTVVLDDRKRELADLAHGDAVGEDADAIERDAAAGGERLVHRIRLERLDADDADVGPHRLDVAGRCRRSARRRRPGRRSPPRRPACGAGSRGRRCPGRR